MRPEIVYGALAALLLFTLAFAFYTFSEIQSVKNQVAALAKKPESTAILVNALERRLSALETELKQQASSAKLIAFYDSSCAVCGNDIFLESIPAIRSNLEKQAIRLGTVDVKDNPKAALAVNVKSVPAFFASSSDLAINPQLVQFVNSLASLSFGLQETAVGVTAHPPTSKIILSSESCAKNDSVKIEEFYSTTCPFCRRVSYANDTPYNPSSSAMFAEVSGEAFDKLLKKYAGKIQNSSRCVQVHSLEENKEVLGVNASDGALCVEQIGEEAFKENELFAQKYGVIGAPSFVVDCKYVTNARESSRLEAALCAFRPDVC